MSPNTGNVIQFPTGRVQGTTATELSEETTSPDTQETWLRLRAQSFLSAYHEAKWQRLLDRTRSDLDDPGTGELEPRGQRQEGSATMDEWLKTLVEQMNEERRASEQRTQASIDRIEHLLERQTDQMESTRNEIKEQNETVNSRIDQAYAHFQSNADSVRQWSFATFLAIAALVVAVVIGFFVN